MVPESVVKAAGAKATTDPLPPAPAVDIDTSGTPIIMNHGAAVGANAATAATTAAVASDTAVIKTTKSGQATKAVKASTKAAAPKRKRKPGRPKAGRLDVPLEPVATAVPKDVEAGPAAVTITTRPAPAPAAPEPAPIEPSVTVAVKPQLPAAPPVRGRRLNDIAPVKRPARVKAPAGEITPGDTPQLKPAAERAAAVSTELPLGLHDRLTLSAFSWSAAAATFLALLVGGGTYVLVGDKAGQAWQLTQRAGWPVWGECALVLGLYYVSRSLASGAITYAAARRADHRQAPPRHQWHAAINSFWSRAGFDLLVVVAQAAVAGLAAALLLMGGTVWPVPNYVQLIVLFMGYLILCYAMVGVSFAQGLGRAGLTLSTISPFRALQLGWQFFSHHFELAGFRVVSLLVELALLAPLVGAVVLMGLYMPANLSWLTPAVAVLLTIAGGGLIGAGMATWWHGIYRRLVIGHRLGEAVTLLSSRRVEKLHRGTYWLTVTLALTLGMAAIAWPWLSQG
jgi:hypothetical protein